MYVKIHFTITLASKENMFLVDIKKKKVKTYIHFTKNRKIN